MGRLTSPRKSKFIVLGRTYRTKIKHRMARMLVKIPNDERRALGIAKNRGNQGESRQIKVGEVVGSLILRPRRPPTLKLWRMRS